ncbi:MAG TPA: response regulator transcription factor [Chloroflexota bacterium]|nr:response regulator transcription factor [Chloroflexota bacterium]
MSDAVRVLVVDDEVYIADLVGTALRYEGFDVRKAGSGREAVSAAMEFRPRLIVLDVMLPDFDGFEVAQRLTAGGQRMPILFLTARDATEDKVKGLSIGGDDYVTKPFSLEELIARVRAILRRTGGEAEPGHVLQFADLEMDEDSHEVRRGGQIVELTTTEYRLLRYLMANPQRVLTRAQIIEHVWEYDFEGEAGVLDTYISYLRKKVDAPEFSPPLIQTVRGVGYVLRLPRS